MGKTLDGQGASDPLPPTWPSGAIRTVVSALCHTVYNFSWRPQRDVADSTEFLGISVCYPSREPGSFGKAKKTPEDCVLEQF